MIIIDRGAWPAPRATHRSPPGQNRGASGEGRWVASCIYLPHWGRSATDGGLFNGSCLRGHLGPREGPVLMRWHSCFVLTPATVIAESPSMHLSPLQSLTALITVLLPAGLFGSTLSSIQESSISPIHCRVALIAFRARPCCCSGRGPRGLAAMTMRGGGAESRLSARESRSRSAREAGEIS